MLAACQSIPAGCPESTGTPKPTLDLAALIAAAPTPGPTPVPEQVVIGIREITADRVVHGPLCNDLWSGTVYVACDVQVAPWEENPLFFELCQLKIEPGTVVYVAAHQDTAYYNGCSCHTGEIESGD